MSQANGKLLDGQQLSPQDSILFQFTEQMVPIHNLGSHLGQPLKDITPVDETSAKVRTYVIPTAALEAYFLATPTTVNLNLPSYLSALAVVYNKSESTGEDIHNAGAGEWEGPSGGLTFSPSSRASASASIIPELTYTIQEFWSNAVPALVYLFYISGTTVTEAQVITRLETILTAAVTSVVAGVVTTAAAHGLVINQAFKFPSVTGGAGGITAGTTYYVKTTPTTTTFTYAATVGGAALSGHSATSATFTPIVLRLPVFHPTSYTFLLKGHSVSISQNADSRFSYQFSASAYSTAITPFGGSRSDGFSTSSELSVRVVRLPPVIHAGFTLSPTSDTAGLTVTVTANTPAVTGSGGAPSFSAVTNAPTAKTGTATGSVTPTSIAATTPSVIPTTGLYITELDAQPYQNGFSRVRAVLVNFSNIQ